MRRSAIPRPMLILMLVTAVLITAAGVVFKQSLINILPLYVSLCVGLLQSRVSRTAYLIGACNSLLYAAVYAHFKLYASAAYAVLFSSTIQFATYFRWKSRPQGQSTLFRAMTNRQRLLVARALAGNPSLLLADEPTGNLDSRTGADVMKLFHELHEAGNTIVLITHDAKIAAQTPRAIHIHDGRVLEPADENEVVI